MGTVLSIPRVFSYRQTEIQLENERNGIKCKVRLQHGRAATIITEHDANFVNVKVRYLSIGVC